MFAPRRLAWLVLILLVASFMRLHDLANVPPGMTHDEADHGLDAWGVVQGERPIYFTVGYGREPLYDYSTALLMSFLGPTFLAGRLSSIFFSLILIAGSYAWIRQALGTKVALLTAAGLALDFWPLMTARQGLRSETLPALLVLAVAMYWKGSTTADARRKTGQSLISRLQSPFIWSGLLLGLTFYTYIPSRILWLLFPALAIVLMLLRRRTPWRGTFLALGVALLVGLPLFLFLWANPGAEARIGQLAQPLQQAASGNFAPLWANVRSGLGIFTIEGDPQWRYNIAGRPLLTPPVGVLFYVGVAWSAWRLLACCVWLHRRDRARFAAGCRQAPALFLALLWLALGLAPVLATGRELSTTQAIGMQPVLYLFPALALVGVARRLQPWLRRRLSGQRRLRLPAGQLVALSLGALLLAGTWRAYFQTWAQHPQVAVQYEAELVNLVRQLNAAADGGDSGLHSAPVAISTDAPGRFHDAATARLYLEDDRRPLRWFDGRHSLLLPAQDGAVVIFSAAAPLNPVLSPYLQALQPTTRSLGSTSAPAHAAVTVELTHSPSRLLHFYPQFSTEINRLSTELSTEINFGDALRFLAYELQTPAAGAGDTLRLATVWQVAQPPHEELVLFSHLLGPEGALLAQADRLDAPVHSWQTGDILIQLHEMHLPADLPAGEYALAVGVYHAADWRRRLPVRGGGVALGDALQLAPLVVAP